MPRTSKLKSTARAWVGPSKKRLMEKKQRISRRNPLDATRKLMAYAHRVSNSYALDAAGVHNLKDRKKVLSMLREYDSNPVKTARSVIVTDVGNLVGIAKAKALFYRKNRITRILLSKPGERPQRRLE